MNQPPLFESWFDFCATFARRERSGALPLNVARTRHALRNSAVILLKAAKFDRPVFDHPASSILVLLTVHFRPRDLPPFFDPIKMFGPDSLLTPMKLP